MSKSKEPKKDDHLDEATLFEACDQLRGSVESADYKQLVLSLVFPKYISDSFETRQQAVDALTRDSKSDWLTDDEVRDKGSGVNSLRRSTSTIESLRLLLINPRREESPNRRQPTINSWCSG